MITLFQFRIAKEKKTKKYEIYQTNFDDHKATRAAIRFVTSLANITCYISIHQSINQSNRRITLRTADATSSESTEANSPAIEWRNWLIQRLQWQTLKQNETQSNIF